MTIAATFMQPTCGIAQNAEVEAEGKNDYLVIKIQNETAPSCITFFSQADFEGQTKQICQSQLVKGDVAKLLGFEAQSYVSGLKVGGSFNLIITQDKETIDISLPFNGGSY